MQNEKLTIALLQCILAFTLITCDTRKEDSSLPQLYIHVNTSDLNFSDYIIGSATYYIGNGLIEFTESPAFIKYRGNSSSHFEKKCFSLKFLDKKCFNTVNCHRIWKLNAEYIDKTFMRNKLSYDLFRLFSEENYAPHINYAILYLNNEFRGIYTLTDRMDEDRLNFMKDDTNAVLFKEPPISFSPEEHAKRYEDFIKYTEWADFYKDFSDKAYEKLIKRVYYNQRFPDIYESNKKYVIHQITAFIFNSSDEDFADEAIFSNYFDINNIIDWHLLLLISNNGDGRMKNFYFYRQGTDEPYKFCPWDYDYGYGRDGDGVLHQDSSMIFTRMKLLVRLVETNAFNYRQRLYDKFLLLKKNDVLTFRNINKMIDDNVVLIKPYIEQNEARWPLDSLQNFTGRNFNKEVSLMKSWIERRLVGVENYLIELNNP